MERSEQEIRESTRRIEEWRERLAAEDPTRCYGAVKDSLGRWDHCVLPMGHDGSCVLERPEAKSYITLVR